ncbi:unnamed protein product [Closterium sp. Naga37s-1]|nr:unnamed protein product [Closterium sp. Naga37s-1]
MRLERGTTGAADCRTASTGMRSLIRRTGIRAADHRAYFRCSSFSLAGIYFCPGTSRFDEEKGRCEEGREEPESAAAAEEEAGAELNALLALKAAVIDFQNALRSWVVPRHAANSSLSPDAFFCRWRFVSCSSPPPPKAAAAGAVAGAVVSRRVIALQILEPGSSSDGWTADIGVLLSSTPNVTTAIATSMRDGGSSSSDSTAIPPLLPQEFSSLTALQNLTIKNVPIYQGIAGLVGAFPTQLSACPSLRKLELAFHRIIGGIPDSISQFKSLKELNLGYNYITGILPTALFSLSNLESLQLSSNAISGPIPPQISLLSKTLMDLDLKQNHLSGSLPEEIGQLKKLGIEPHFAGLSLRGNNFSGSLPASISNLQSLQNLDLSNNQFSGSLPQGGAFLSALTNLASLQITDNRFTGSLPLSFACTTSILTISLGSNQFWGTLPGNLDNCAMILMELDVLDVSGNGLSSSLPSALGSLSYLSLLDVSRNGLSGPIPPELAPPFLPFLSLLNVSHNAFSGAIPFGFSNSNTTATALDFSHNNLSGQIYPGNLSLLPASAFAANPALCGGAGYPDCPAPPGQALSTGAVVGIVVGCVAALALAVGGVWYALFFQRTSGLEGGTMLVFERLDFKLNIRSILDATDTFSSKFLLGRGGFGSVYNRRAGGGDKAAGSYPPPCSFLCPAPSLPPPRTCRATLADGREVAIKQLAQGSSQGEREFEAEMHTLGAVRHRNLVVLVAAYLSRPPSQERLLIYDFLPGGSLDDILDRDMPKGSPMRRWEIVSGKLLSDKVLSETVISRWVSTNPLEEIVDRRIKNWEKYTDEMEAVVMLGVMCTARLPADRPSMIEALEVLEGLSTFALSMRKGESWRGESVRGESGRGESWRGGSGRGESLEVRGCEEGSEGAEGDEEVSSVWRENGSGRRQEEKQEERQEQTKEEREEVKLEVSKAGETGREKGGETGGESERKEEKQEESKEEIQDEKQEEKQEETGGTRRETGRETG